MPGGRRLCKCVDQGSAARTAPPGYKVVAGYRRVAAADATGDVMKIGVVTRPHAKRINGRINEADRRIAIKSRLLIDQGHVTSPHGRRKTGAAILVCRAGGLPGTNVKAEV